MKDSKSYYDASGIYKTEGQDCENKEPEVSFWWLWEE
jgi:hypothetical protein